MLKISADQLAAQLQEGLRSTYMLTGNDPLLHQESQQAILATARQQQFPGHQTFTIDSHTDWELLFSECQAMSLFTQQQVFILQLPENGPSAAQATHLLTLSRLLHSDLVIILHCTRLTKAQENSPWYQALVENGLSVLCQTPDQKQLPRWVQQRCRHMGLSIDDAAVQLLCYCYEGNLLALAQALERLSLLWPEGSLTLPRVEQAVNNAAIFTTFQWIDALLAGKSHRALHILHQLLLEGTEPVILLRTLQREMMILLELNQPGLRDQRAAMDRLRIWQNRRGLYTETLKRADRSRFRVAVRLLAQAEVTLKQDYSADIGSTLETLSLLLSQPQFPAGLYDV